ncbi:AAA family ATPase [Streptomyces sp. NBC_00576]|uniref:AAA family ATPase n=1 Tax=Streptomyces sp. NBC_00576 TaxID=2903665 RepID=UPI002E80D7A8|nr:AAA family ATPase [Streptomyces sp. NBC_00576]WUB72026.1 AAA family ATPase [Streptomyces sp. NBC_00576]
MSETARLHAFPRSLPDEATQGIADARLLPDEEFREAWSSIAMPTDMKERMLRGAVSSIRLRQAVPFDAVPLHGITLLTGAPGVGKTTVARGLADKIARTLGSPIPWMFLEIDPHALASASLGRSQRSVETLFGTVIEEMAIAGPLVVLVDEVETLLTDRAALSMDANPIDVHRAVDAALVGLDRLARRHTEVFVLATSNFPDAIDPALASRADNVIRVPLPDRTARRWILEHTVRAIARAFPGAQALTADEALDAAAERGEGLDGRRLRKAVAAACAYRPETKGDPNGVTVQDLLAALDHARETA